MLVGLCEVEGSRLTEHGLRSSRTVIVSGALSESFALVNPGTVSSLLYGPVHLFLMTRVPPFDDSEILH